MKNTLLRTMVFLGLSLSTQAVNLPSNNLKDYHLVYTTDVILNQNFNNIYSGYSMPQGWKVIKSGVVKLVYSNSYSGSSNRHFKISSGSSYGGTNMVITSKLEKLGGGSTVKFVCNITDGNPGLTVGLLTDPSDENSFTAIETVVPNRYYYNNFEVEIPAGIEGKYIGFKLDYSGQYQSLYLNNLVVTAKTLGIKTYSLD